MSVLESLRDSSLVRFLPFLVGRELNDSAGLDFPLVSTYAIVKNHALEFWEWMFQHTNTATNGTGSYTCELHILENERVIFTADPENTKSILTTQFQEFGKGMYPGAIWYP